MCKQKFEIRDGTATSIMQGAEQIEDIFEIIFPSDISNPIYILCYPNYDKNTVNKFIKDYFPMGLPYKIVAIDFEHDV